MEKIFKARWWDYHNRKFNINGRICLETLIPFGLLGTILLKFINPFILNLISKIPSNILKWILIVLFVIIGIDTFISFFVIGNLRKTAKEVEKEAIKDNTEEISNKVKEITTQKAEEIINNTRKNLESLPDKISNNARKFEENIHYRGEKIKTALYEKIMTTKEYTEEVKKKFDRNWLNRRFLKAFPNMQISSKILKLKEKIDKK